ncbi:hypothetical protein LCI18_000716 [Fusarium solani-melongenae]|uniref:Uncharacterized protein n=1 Tax=Fusarium solani subsp. cucurbitae TaxID=2747967 RepID=A0ACD3YMF5_FUSSC|nr:hypothetical protein LCI18_000716 [Fusarium solani-melongenae]
MASVSSRPSPNSSSPYDFESAPETDETWQYIDYTASSSGPSSIGFLSDPASGSLGSFAMIGNVHGNSPSPYVSGNTPSSYVAGSTPSPYMAGNTPSPYVPGNTSSPFVSVNTPSPYVSGNDPSPSAASPLLLGEMDQTTFFSSNPSFPSQSENGNSDMFATATTTADGGFGPAQGFMTPQQYLFPQQQQDASQFSPQGLNGMLVAQRTGPSSRQGADETADMTLINNFGADMFSTGSGEQVQVPQVDLNMPQPLQSDPNVPPWNPTNTRGSEGIFIMDDFSSSPSPKSIHSQSSFSSNKASYGSSSGKSSTQIRKVKTGKVEKKKTEQSGKFVIVTPNSISAHAGRPNPFECFEAMTRTSQRGRKGPLANATKENALQVRRLGACFCCHSRKVKCDKERPCKSCKKLMMQVPQVVCWQFQDFVPILFPDFIRGHLRKEVMSKFTAESIVSFQVNGVEQGCSVELFSGGRFQAVLAIEAKFFTPKTPDIIQHWHMVNVGPDRVELQSNGAAAIAVELEKTAERDNLKKRTKRYIQELITEPGFVDQVTESFRSTQLPRKILGIIKQYADETESLMVKRALSIYCMHYIMTRQLCLTRHTVDSLRSTGMIAQNDGFVTPRMLARQIKSVVDELMLREMQQLFELFSKSLKPKIRREWAPCTAAFLVLCLFMEAVETAADTFVVAGNEISMRNSARPEYDRSVALNTCKEVENMPFKQFAYQFHQVYQTHTKEANAKSFNPLFDSSFAEQGELDGPAVTFAAQLRELFFGEDWLELQFLAANDILPNSGSHPFPMSPETLYTGRLVAKFLMSFTDDKAIFGDSV